MKILYFHQHFSTPQGATGTRSYEFAQALLARGHDVTMVCGSFNLGHTSLAGEGNGRWRRGRVEGIDVIEYLLPYGNTDGFAKRTFTFLKFAAFCVRLALFENYDLLFATSTPLTVGIPGIVMKWFRKKKFVFEVRDLWPELPREMKVIRNPLVLFLMGVLEKLSYRAADGCVALSPGISRGIEARLARKPVRIAMIPNGCDLSLFTPLARTERVTLPHCAPSDFVAVFTGTHGLANGLDAALDAAAELKRRAIHDIKIVFIGDGREKKRLQARAQTEGLTNCVFLPPCPKTELARITASADAGLQILSNVPAFYRGTSPNKFFDYLAAGIPVVNNYPGWIAELIAHHDCGLAVPPERPDLLADALVHLARDPALRDRLAGNARRLAESDFDRRALSARFVEALEGA